MGDMIKPDPHPTALDNLASKLSSRSPEILPLFQKSNGMRVEVRPYGRTSSSCIRFWPVVGLLESA